MKTCPDFEKRSDATVDLCGARRRLYDAAQNLQQCALACAVASNNADYFAFFNIE